MERLTFAASGKVEGRTLSGVVHVYGSVTTDGRKHSFSAGAFTKSIAKGQVVSFAFHDATKPLGSQKSGTLRLSDGQQLTYSIDLPDTSYANDLRAYVDAGNDLGMSFQVAPTSRPKREAGVTTWSEGELVSVDPVAMPAFEGTSVILNSAQDGEPAYSTTIKLRARRLAANVIASLTHERGNA